MHFIGLDKGSSDVAAEGAILNEMLEIVAKRAALRSFETSSSASSSVQHANSPPLELLKNHDIHQRVVGNGSSPVPIGVSSEDRRNFESEVSRKRHCFPIAYMKCKYYQLLTKFKALLIQEIFSVLTDIGVNLEESTPPS